MSNYRIQYELCEEKIEKKKVFIKAVIREGKGNKGIEMVTKVDGSGHKCAPTMGFVLGLCRAAIFSRFPPLPFHIHHSQASLALLYL